MGSWEADDLASRLEVEPLSEREFESSLESFDGRTFGGEILAKAVMAGLRTCPERSLHSVHAYFLRPVPPERTVHFAVHVLRDGRRLSGRRVVVGLDGRRAAEVSLSLTADLAGPGFEGAGHRLDVPPPDDLPTRAELAATEDWTERPQAPLDWRYVEAPWKQPVAGESARWRAWIRPNRPLPDEPRFHAAALAYLSDYGSLGVVQRYFGEAFEWEASTSLDHAFWLHRPFRWTDWVLMESDADIAFAGRALTERRIYAADGRPIASMAQEGLFSVKSGD